MVANRRAPFSSQSVYEPDEFLISHARSSCPVPEKSPAPTHTGLLIPLRAMVVCQALPFQDTRSIFPFSAPALAGRNHAISLLPLPEKSPATPGSGILKPVPSPTVPNPVAPSNSHSVLSPDAL